MKCERNKCSIQHVDENNNNHTGSHQMAQWSNYLHIKMSSAIWRNDGVNGINELTKLQNHWKKCTNNFLVVYKRIPYATLSEKYQSIIIIFFQTFPDSDYINIVFRYEWRNGNKGTKRDSLFREKITFFLIRQDKNNNKGFTSGITSERVRCS